MATFCFIFSSTFLCCCCIPNEKKYQKCFLEKEKGKFVKSIPPLQSSAFSLSLTFSLFFHLMARVAADDSPLLNVMFFLLLLLLSLLPGRFVAAAAQTLLRVPGESF